MTAAPGSRDEPPLDADATRPIEVGLREPYLTVPVPRDAEPTVPPASEVTVPIPTQAPAVESEVVLRFGPGVPVQRPARAFDAQPQRPSRWRWRAVNVVLTAALAVLVLWLLWPSAPVKVRQVTVQAPAIVDCASSADVVATLQTNGQPGTIRYRWIRNDGVVSGVLTARPARGQHTVDVHLRWSFTGPGTYAATATLEVLEPAAVSASASFAYRC